MWTCPAQEGCGFASKSCGDQATKRAKMERCKIHAQCALEHTSCDVLTTFFIPKDGFPSLDAIVGANVLWVVSAKHRHAAPPSSRPPNFITLSWRNSIAAMQLLKGDWNRYNEASAKLEAIKMKHSYFASTPTQSYQRRMALKAAFPHGMGLDGVLHTFQNIGSGGEDCYVQEANKKQIVMQFNYQKRLLNAVSECTEVTDDTYPLVDGVISADQTYSDHREGYKWRVTVYCVAFLFSLILFEAIMFGQSAWDFARVWISFLLPWRNAFTIGDASIRPRFTLVLDFSDAQRKGLMMAVALWMLTYRSDEYPVDALAYDALVGEEAQFTFLEKFVVDNDVACILWLFVVGCKFHVKQAIKNVLPRVHVDIRAEVHRLLQTFFYESFNEAQLDAVSKAILSLAPKLESWISWWSNPNRAFMALIAKSELTIEQWKTIPASLSECMNAAFRRNTKTFNASLVEAVAASCNSALEQLFKLGRASEGDMGYGRQEDKRSLRLLESCLARKDAKLAAEEHCKSRFLLDKYSKELSATLLLLQTEAAGPVDGIAPTGEVQQYKPSSSSSALPTPPPSAPIAVSVPAVPRLSTSLLSAGSSSSAATNISSLSGGAKAKKAEAVKPKTTKVPRSTTVVANAAQANARLRKVNYEVERAGANPPHVEEVSEKAGKFIFADNLLGLIIFLLFFILWITSQPEAEKGHGTSP